MNICAIDFEYKHSSEPGMGIISCVTLYKGVICRFWLWDPMGLGISEKDTFISYVNSIKKEAVFTGYNIHMAEARCFAALGLNPTDFLWRDLMLDWRWRRNWDDRYEYGHVMTAQGFARYTVPPVARVRKKASQEEEDAARTMNKENLEQLTAEQEDGDERILSNDAAGESYLDCLYFFETIDAAKYREAQKTKNEMREGLIMVVPDAEIEKHKKDILAYNEGDIFDIPSLAASLSAKMLEAGEQEHLLTNQGEYEFHSFQASDIEQFQLNMGEWAARTALYAYRGVPLNKDRLSRLLEVVPDLTKETLSAWGKDHPEAPLYRVGFSETILEKRKSMAKQSPYVNGTLVADNNSLLKLIELYCESTGIDNWPKTKTGKWDTSKKVLERNATGENIIKHLLRHKDMLSTLRTFSKTPKGIEALQYIGSDSIQRPLYNPYGTQTARNAHKTKSLVPANSHVFRFLIDPPRDESIICLDFAGEEIFIGGSNSRDEVFKKAYKSEDFYMAYAQLRGMYPEDLPIPSEEQRKQKWFEEFKPVRSVCKTLCLSISYGAGGRSIAAAVRDATRDESIGPEQGYAWQQEYRETFADFTLMNEQVREYYLSGVPLILPSGWRLGPNNPSPLSASNFIVQGRGSCILQTTCRKMDALGLKVIFTMHDEIAVICATKDEESTCKLMKQCMLDAAQEVLGEPGMKVGEPEIIRHGDWWIDHSDKAIKGWDKIGKYFETLKNTKIF